MCVCVCVYVCVCVCVLHCECYMSVLCHVQTIEVQHAQQIRALEEGLEKKVEELKETHQQVRHNLECNHFENTTGHLLQLQKTEGDLQEMDKRITQVEDILETKQGTKQSLQRCIYSIDLVRFN